MLTKYCFLGLFISSFFISTINAQLTQIKAERNGRSYSTLNFPAVEPGGNTLLTGIRGGKKNPSVVYITGNYVNLNAMSSAAFIYKGKLSGKGVFHPLSFPSALDRTVTSTALYGPNVVSKSVIQAVGNYTTVETGQHSLGCLYSGDLGGLGNWTTLIPISSEPVIGVIAHSVMAGFVVGNYDTSLKVNQAFLYDIEGEIYYNIVKPGAKDTTAYGIWHNGGNSYTICGGYTGLGSADFESGYLVEWDRKTKKFHHWRSYDFNNDPSAVKITHFDGITSDNAGGYYLTGDYVEVKEVLAKGFFCHIKKKQAKWSTISYPHQLVTSGNSVYEKAVIGAYVSVEDQSTNGYISVPIKHRASKFSRLIRCR